MQTKNNPSEFSNKQCNQLKGLREMVRLHKLQEKCEKFKNELEDLTTERRQCLENQENRMGHFTAIQDEHKIAKNEKSTWQIKLEDVKNSVVDDTIENLQNTCLILGYNISSCHLLENNGLNITLMYRDICYVSYSETAEGLRDVVEIHPPHPNFTQIQQFLQKSQDLRGLLTCLHKFFDFVIQTKENREK